MLSLTCRFTANLGSTAGSAASCCCCCCHGTPVALTSALLPLLPSMLALDVIALLAHLEQHSPHRRRRRMRRTTPLRWQLRGGQGRSASPMQSAARHCCCQQARPWQHAISNPRHPHQQLQRHQPGDCHVDLKAHEHQVYRKPQRHLQAPERWQRVAGQSACLQR